MHIAKGDAASLIRAPCFPPPPPPLTHSLALGTVPGSIGGEQGEEKKKTKSRNETEPTRVCSVARAFVSHWLFSLACFILHLALGLAFAEIGAICIVFSARPGRTMSLLSSPLSAGRALQGRQASTGAQRTKTQRQQGCPVRRGCRSLVVRNAASVVEKNNEEQSKGERENMRRLMQQREDCLNRLRALDAALIEAQVSRSREGSCS